MIDWFPWSIFMFTFMLYNVKLYCCCCYTFYCQSFVCFSRIGPSVVSMLCASIATDLLGPNDRSCLRYHILIWQVQLSAISVGRLDAEIFYGSGGLLADSLHGRCLAWSWRFWVLINRAWPHSHHLPAINRNTPRANRNEAERPVCDNLFAFKVWCTVYGKANICQLSCKIDNSVPLPAARLGWCQNWRPDLSSAK